jgi:cytoskeleton protein RodZ
MEADSSARAAPGARLSEARQAQGLATSDVARRLKLSVGQVEALEAGRYHDLPGAIFVRGFIRNYAKLVRLDPEELLQSGADSLPQATPRPEMPPSPNIPFPTATTRRWPQFTAGVAVVVVGLLAVYEFAGNEGPQTVATSPAVEAPPAKPSPAKKSAPAQSPSPAAAARPGAPGNPPEGTAPIARHASPAVLIDPAAPAPPPVTASVPALTTAPQPQERVATGEEREVRFVFDEESWVEVRDRNDTVIFYQLNASGTARRVSGLPPLTIVVGNAHGVRMTYAGKPIDLARHTKIDVARLTLE